ncbi:SUN domain-containing ossification factor isoform X2 [Periplaneta americana]|uniref:SUN domain-containing ossification factor isoform X2 n=1 Tax=Periplaneta americana TaxID=6978 RepID=UPI0037E98CA9
MKFHVCCIYWTLLFLSFISSCLLFILVATEGGVGESSVKVLSDNGTFNSEISVKSTGTLDIREDQQKDEIADINENEKDQNHEKFEQTQQKHENVAEIHSSFEEVVSSSNVNGQQPDDAVSYIISPEPISDITTEIFETGQAVVFTLVDTASAELQDHASSPSHHIEGLLGGTKNDNLSAAVPEASESQIVRPPMSVEDDTLPDGEETSKNLSIGEDVDDKIFQEKDKPYIVRAEPKVVELKDEIQDEKGVAAVPTEVADIKEVKNDSMKDTVPGDGAQGKPFASEGSEHGASSEDIPSFSEWAQKQLAEAEKKKIQNSTMPPTGSPSRASGNLKIRSKNYASPDCGAKIVGTNPEAMYAGSIISPSRDEYVLNACSNRFWFVVELCEAIQAKKIELANFELFSSSPRDFSVSLSDRFPSRDWRSVGHFTAKDERDIQSFNLDPHLFGKFIKVELHSHYGSEHYCPISLFRVYGTSEFEVLETEVEVHESVPNMADDDDDEEPLDVDTGEPPKTLFGSAQDAVMSIVKKAAQALVKSGDLQNDTTTSENVDMSHSNISERENCVSPSHIVVCDNCSDAMFNQVFGLLSCRGAYLQSLIDTPFVRSSFQTSRLCVEYGFDFSSHRTGAPYPLRPSANGVHPLRLDRSSYLSALLPPEYIAALCNILAILEKKVVFNVSYEVNKTTTINLTSSIDENTSSIESDFGNLVISHLSTCTMDSSLTSRHCSSASVSDSSNIVGFSTSSLPVDSSAAATVVASQIKPTKTLVKEPDKKDFPSAVPIKTSCDQGNEATVIADSSSVQELPASVPSSVTISISPGEENKTGTSSEAIKESAEPTKTTLPSSGSVKVDTTQELSSTSEVEQQQQQTVGSEKVGDVLLEEKYQESQDSLSLDSFLLSELKDLDMGLDSSSSALNPSITTTVTPPSLAQTQQVQKESVFVRLSNRIKALERNMSLSGQYLEELSRRYKKQVEEMQKAFNRTLAAVGEESRKGEEREQKRVEEMAALHKQLATLTNAVEMLLEERDSWQHKAAVIVQHVVLIVIEVIVFGVILYFCRRLPETSVDTVQRKWSFGWRVEKSKKNGTKAAPNRRRSIDGVNVHEAPKIHNRRPSEEALNISGTYSDLLIEPNITEIDGGTGTVPKAENKRRRRKKKEALLKSSSSANLISRTGGRRVSEHSSLQSESENVLTRRASSSELGKWHSFSNGVALEKDNSLVSDSLSTKHNGLHSPDNDQDSLSVEINGSSRTSSKSGSTNDRESPPRKESADLQVDVGVGNMSIRTKEKLGGNSPPSRQGNGTIKSTELNPKVRRLSSPFFMKTAISARNNRLGSNTESSLQARLKSDNWEWYSSRRAASVASDKSSQGSSSPPPSHSASLQNGNGLSSTGQNGHNDLDQTSEASGSHSAEVLQRDCVKKVSNSSGLKKMVKKFF